jgi:cation diffusion facilitator CzcD-associated flavoprotein CzcO
LRDADNFFAPAHKIKNMRGGNMSAHTPDLDAIVIGAGFSGIHMLKSLRDKLGLKVRVYEEAETVGGTWYWNRYPGARCDSDAYIYCFTWDKQLLQEWEWSERYPQQPEILRYLEHVAARHGLKPDMQFNTRIVGGEFDESTNLWKVRTDKGEESTARFLIAAVGTLSSTNLPRFAGLERFKGKWYHTSRFPKLGVDFTGKKVAVVGTGATAVQAIPEIAQQAKHLVVFQRTANYCVPARNGKKGGLRGHHRAHSRVILWPGALLHPQIRARGGPRGARA